MKVLNLPSQRLKFNFLKKKEAYMYSFSFSDNEAVKIAEFLSSAPTAEKELSNVE